MLHEQRVFPDKPPALQLCIRLCISGPLKRLKLGDGGPYAPSIFRTWAERLELGGKRTVGVTPETLACPLYVTGSAVSRSTTIASVLARIIRKLPDQCPGISQLPDISVPSALTSPEYWTEVVKRPGSS